MPQRRLTSILLMLFLLALAGGFAATNQSPRVPTPQTPTVSPAPESPSALQPYPGPQAQPQPVLSPRLQAILDQARRDHRNGDLASALVGYRKTVAGGDAPAEALLELSQVEMAGGDFQTARETLTLLLSSAPEEPLVGRARLLLAAALIALGDGGLALRQMEGEAVPDGLGDLVALLRGEAALGLSDAEGARQELARPALRESTNRLLLERAGGLAEQAGDTGLAGELYAQGARFFGWTVERTRILQAAGAALAQAGNRRRAVEQYRTLLEVYGWTEAGRNARVELWHLGGLTSYHAGLLALQEGRRDDALWAFAEAAAEGGEYASAASRQMRLLEEAEAWRAAYYAGSAEDYLSFRTRYPEAANATEARFQEGLVHYEAGRLVQALAVWEEGVAGTSGDDRARLLLWAGKTLSRLGREGDAETSLRAAASTHPAGYYTLRARDLLAGERGWPGAGGVLKGGGEAEQAEADQWIESWAGPATSGEAEQLRVRRGLGLLALGMRPEAAAEFNGLIPELREPRRLFRMAGALADEGLWSSASRAAAQLAALSPGRTLTEAPRAVQRLGYPAAYWELVARESERRKLDPLLLLSLMHQESRYDPLALSVSEARGLTQVIPPTGRGIAGALGRTAFSPEDLYRPPTAVEFGAWYLANQLATFGGDPFRALAAYNAGAGPIPRWASPDPDLFVERIDYSETRRYLRQLYLHYALYRGLTEP